MSIEQVAQEVAQETDWKDAAEFLRRCLSKMAEQAGEPVADVVWFDPALELFTERKPHKVIDGSLTFMDTAELGTKLFTEAQLIAAQQRTAEACAKVIRGEGTGFADDDEELNRIAAMLEAGEWRKYL